MGLRARVKRDWDDFWDGFRSEVAPGEDPAKGVVANARRGSDQARAAEAGTVDDTRFRPFDLSVAMVAVLPYALAFGIVVGGAGLQILPWGSAAGFGLLAVAWVASSFWNGFAEGSSTRRTTTAAGYVVVLATHLATRRFVEEPNVLLNGFFLAMVNKELNRAYPGRQWMARIVTLVFPFLVTVSAVVRDEDRLPFSGAPATVGNGIADLVRVGIVLGLLQMTARQFKSQERERERVKAIEAERDAALAGERSRIARELHDVVAHHVSVMTIQAEGARELLPDRPGKAVAVLDQISATGRAALTELRRMLGVLRAGDDVEGPEREPQPGADALEALVAGTTAAGLPTTLTTEGEVRPLPAGVELSIYRIVQEALTNALKHAGQAMATVTIRYGDEAVDVSIVDDGAGSTARTPGGGHGLIGMRERVELLGGEFDAGPRRRGGFEVSVRLPIAAEQVQPS